jgi:nucleoside-diphosphate-sugar epimerase
MIFTVFGSSGFIGGALAARLRALGHTVHAPPRDRAGWQRSALGHAIYAIGLTADFRARPFDTVRAHVSVLADCLESADFQSFTYLSSTRVYQKSRAATVGLPLAVDPADPSDLYNLTKLTGESLCLNCGRAGTRVVRLSNVVGKAAAASDNFVDQLVREARGGHIMLRSDPGCAKDYIRLDDVVEMLPRIAAGGGAGVYHLASGVNLTHREWIEALRELTGCRVSVPEGGEPQVFPPIDIRALVEEFDFTPRPVLELLPTLLT